MAWWLVERGEENVFGDFKVLCSWLSKHITLARWSSLSEVIVAWMEIRSALSSHSLRSTVSVWSRKLRAKSNQHCLIKYLCISHGSYLHWQHSTSQIACFLIPCGPSPNFILDLQIDPLRDARRMLRHERVWFLVLNATETESFCRYDESLWITDCLFCCTALS